jgi:DNA-binding CsgD family transcriptional regulator
MLAASVLTRFLKPSDERRLLDAFRDLYALSDMDTYALRVITALGTLIQAKFITYNEIHPDSARNRYVWWPPKTQPKKGWPLYKAFERHVGEHPLIKHYARTRDPRPLAISDLLTRREWHRTNLFKEFFKPLGLEHQLAVTLEGPRGVVIGIALSRGEKDFSMRERRLLELLRPHLIQAYENAAVASHLKRSGRRRAGARAAPANLSARQLEVLSWVAKGKTNAEIGALLRVSPRTVQKHLEHVYRELGVESRTAAVMRAIELSLVIGA